MNKSEFFTIEILSLFKNIPLWTTMAWKDIVAKYKRTFLGPFWVSLAILIFIVSISIVYSQILKTDIKSYIPYLSFGVITWMFIATTIMESCSCFVDYGGYIKQIKIPYLSFVLRVLVRNNIIFLHNVPIALLVLIVFNVNIDLFSLPFLFFNLFILNLNLLWICMLLAIFSLRFRDVQQFIATIIQPIFFITPVIWNPESIASSRFVIDFNLFYYLIELVRGIFIKTADMHTVILLSMAIGIIGCIIATLIFKKYHKKISLWV
jgi:ABC-type polysaccharide/polyol phosphate export permease